MNQIRINKSPDDYSVITFRKLHKISNRNHGRYNRNIHTELLRENFPKIKNKIFRIERILDHHHFRGEPVELHYRCFVHIPEVDSMLIQDVSVEQWKDIKNSEERMRIIKSQNN